MAHTRRSTWCSLRRLGPVHRCALLLRAGMRCTWCGVGLVQATAQLDHVVPRCDGGGDGDDNLVAACEECNQRRPAGWATPTEQLSAPVDLRAGRALALQWYPWAAKRLGLDKPARELSQSPGAVKMRRLRARWREQPAGVPF